MCTKHKVIFSTLSCIRLISLLDKYEHSMNQACLRNNCSLIWKTRAVLTKDCEVQSSTSYLEHEKVQNIQLSRF